MLKHGFPLVFAMCIYHGKAPYKGPKSIYDLFANPELAKEYIPYLLNTIDLPRFTDKEYKIYDLFGLIGLCLEASATGKFSKAMQRDVELEIFEKLENSDLFDYIMNNVIFYSSITGEKQDIEKAHDIIKCNLPKIQKYMQTYAEAKIQEGILIGEKKGQEIGVKIGEKRGEAKNKIAIAKSMYTNKIDVELIEKITGLSREIFLLRDVKE